MKKTISYDVNNKTVEWEINYIPFRYILAVLITLFEVLCVIAIVAALCYYVPYFYLAAWATEIVCVIRIIASDDNPDYKVPWLLFVLIIPIGVLIESPGCFPGLTVWDNMMLQAANLDIPNAEKEVVKILKLVRMEGAAGNKYKNCSLGMKQRIGIAMALLGNPALLVLDEPLNGLDADGMRIMREVLCDIIKDGKRSILVSSHLLGELQKVATHYGIIRHGKMICEMTAAELDVSCRTYVALQAEDINKAKMLLMSKYSRVELDEADYLRVYDMTTPEEIVAYLYQNGICVTEIKTDKIGLEEYYIDLMKGGK